MARQAGDIRITGTIDEFCFYKMDGEYYVRKKSGLTGKRFRKDKAFEGSRRSCNRFAEGNRIASKVYKTVDEGGRVYSLFCFLKRRAIALLKCGMGSEKVELTLVEYLVDFGIVKKEVKKVIVLARANLTPVFPATEFNSTPSVARVFYEAPD